MKVNLKVSLSMIAWRNNLFQLKSTKTYDFFIIRTTVLLQNKHCRCNVQIKQVSRRITKSQQIIIRSLEKSEVTELARLTSRKRCSNKCPKIRRYNICCLKTEQLCTDAAVRLNHKGGWKRRRDKIIAAFIRHLERIYELGGAKSLFLRQLELWARFLGTIMPDVRGQRTT